MYSFSYSVNVTFRVNSSPLTVSLIYLELTQEESTQWGPRSNMVSDGGDYWSLIAVLEPGDYVYKYGAQIKTKMELLVIIGKMIFSS